MTLDLTYGPLIFGVTWGAVLVIMGLHLRNQGIVIAQSQASSVSPTAATVQYKDPR